MVLAARIVQCLSGVLTSDAKRFGQKTWNEIKNVLAHRDNGNPSEVLDGCRKILRSCSRAGGLHPQKSYWIAACLLKPCSLNCGLAIHVDL